MFPRFARACADLAWVAERIGRTRERAMLAEGLERYGFADKAAAVRQDIVELVQRFGFHEYFDPYEGRGYGSDSFSWSAALLIDTLYRLDQIAMIGQIAAGSIA